MKKSFAVKAIMAPFFMWLVALVIVPTVLVVYYAFTVETADGIRFSLQNFKEIANSMYLEIMLRSLWMAVVSTLICLVIAYPVAMFLAREENREKSWLLLLLIIPMWMNFLLRTYAWLKLLENTGLINQFLNIFGIPSQQFLYNNGAVIFGIVYDLLPYMIFPIYTSLSKIPKNMLEAAADLGANPFVRFMKITLPCSMPGILSGVLMVFIPSITNFAISSLYGGGKVALIGDKIQEQFRSASNWHLGAMLAFVVMVIIILGLFLSNKFSDDDEGEVTMIW